MASVLTIILAGMLLNHFQLGNLTEQFIFNMLK